MVELVTGRFKRNWVGFCGRYWWLVLLFVVAVCCDGASTVRFMLRDGGVADEVHPGVAFAASLFGPIVGPILGALGKAVAGILVAVYCRRVAVYILGVGTVLSFWAAWYNIWGVDMYVPRLLTLIPLVIGGELYSGKIGTV